MQVPEEDRLVGFPKGFELDNEMPEFDSEIEGISKEFAKKDTASQTDIVHMLKMHEIIRNAYS